MKKSFYFLMSAAAVVFLAAGCVKDIPVESVSVEPETLTLAVGASSSLTVTVVPEDADYTLSFTSSNGQVATVSGEGVVEALSDGTATITVDAGNFSAKCEVTVIVPTLDVSPSVESVSFEGVRTRTQEFTVTTNASEWTAEPDADWLSVEYTETGFILEAAANLSMEEGREGSVTISAEGFDPVVIPVNQQEMRMYIGGNDTQSACYWLNGERHVVAEGAYMYVNDLTVTMDGTVHVVGRQGLGSTFAAYWSEELGWNTFQPYSNCSGNANGITVDEETGDVYFSAYYYYYNADYTQTTIAGYHKNLVWQACTSEEPSTAAQAGGIIFQDGNLYMILQENGLSYYTVNGERHELEIMDQGNYTSSLYVKDGDVYVGGWYLTELNGELIYAPCYWKNGEGIALAVEYACPYAIYVDDEDNVWLAGAKGPGFDRCAAYWKNSEPSVDLSSYNNGCAGGITVVDGNIIVTGFESGDTGNSVIKYWINGEETAVTDGSLSCSCEATVII